MRAARQWLTSQRSWFWFLGSSKSIPTEVLYAADDKEVRRLGRRRMFLALWLPAVLAFLLVMVGNCFVAEYDVKVWYYSNTDPQRKPLKIEKDQEDKRLYAFNLNLKLFSPIPANWVANREWTLKRLRFDPPPRPDFVSFLFGCSPLVVIISGHLPCFLVTRYLTARASRRQTLERFDRSARTAMLHLTAPPGFALWLWAVLVFLDLGPFHTPWAGFTERVEPVLLPLSLLAWVVVNCLVWGRLWSLDRAKRLFTAGVLAVPALVTLSLAGLPLTVVIMRLLAL